MLQIIKRLEIIKSSILIEDIEIIDYNPHPFLRIPVSK